MCSDLDCIFGVFGRIISNLLIPSENVVLWSILGLVGAIFVISFFKEKNSQTLKSLAIGFGLGLGSTVTGLLNGYEFSWSYIIVGTILGTILGGLSDLGKKLNEGD